MRSSPNRGRWALVPLLLLAWALRLPPILDNRFHPDEALYGYWGLLIGRGQDPWLATVPVYKPPLLPYLVAGAQALFGNSEFTVRMPGLAAGLLTVSLVAALAHSLYHDRWAAVAAAAGVAFSPFAILFSATAFPDPLMVALGLGACVAAARGRPGWAGLLAGLAFATKQTGLVWVPLALGVNLIQIPNPKSQIPKLVICLSLVVGVVFGWDALRVAQGAESFWRMGITGYGGLRLIWPQELWTRLRGWIGLGRYLFVSPVVNGALLVGLSALVWGDIKHRRYPETRFLSKTGFLQQPFTDLLLISFCLIYFLLHWLFAFPVWDRYLLPLVPVLAVLLGRTLALLASRLQSIIDRLSLVPRHSSFVIRHLSFIICHLLFAICLALPAFDAAHSRYPVGGDHGAYDGIDEVATFLHGLPEGTVVYQHWLGWHYAYYLFDAPVCLAYWPTPAWLSQDVRAFGATEPRYVAFPSWESRARAEWALATVGYGLEPALTTTRRDDTPSFTVYHIIPVPSR
ncbi:MAG: glycosyltransferase family 39 protein [Anaerolineae bacterium]|nr:glycosyltransferase family 39 protein [Anaerolineae bacterium]